MKTCRRCGISKDITEFYRNRAKEDGRSIYCRPCDNGAGKDLKTYVVGENRKCILCCEYFPNTTDYFKEENDSRSRKLKPLSDTGAAKPCRGCLKNKAEKMKKVGKERKNNNDAQIHSWPFEPGTFCAISQKYLMMRLV